MQILVEEIDLFLVLVQLDQDATARVTIVSLLANCYGEGGLHLFLLGRAGHRFDRVLHVGLCEVLNIVWLVSAYLWVLSLSPTLVLARLLECLLL